MRDSRTKNGAYEEIAKLLTADVELAEYTGVECAVLAMFACQYNCLRSRTNLKTGQKGTMAAKSSFSSLHKPLSPPFPQLIGSSMLLECMTGRNNEQSVA